MAKLDLAFVLDCTGTMGTYIDAAKANIRKIVETIVSTDKRDIKLALVEYRDHDFRPGTGYDTVRSRGFTPSVVDMKSWLNGCYAVTDGYRIDYPEAVEDGLYELTELVWRNDATKVAVLVGDDAPHGLGHGYGHDNYPNGCPKGHDPIVITKTLASMGIVLYVAGCEPSISQYKDFFTGLAYITGGQYVPLASSQSLATIIMCGVEEEMALEKLMERELGPARQQLINMVGYCDEDLLQLHLVAEMARKGITTKRLMRNHASMGDVSDKAKAIAEMRDLAQYRATDLSRVRPSAVASAAVSDVFDIEESEVDYAQVQRMVQKSKMRNKALFDD